MCDLFVRVANIFLLKFIMCWARNRVLFIFSVSLISIHMSEANRILLSPSTHHVYVFVRNNLAFLEEKKTKAYRFRPHLMPSFGLDFDLNTISSRFMQL